MRREYTVTVKKKKKEYLERVIKKSISFFVFFVNKSVVMPNKIPLIKYG
jgi:hypothetical protein